jgi:hypothetical protein
MTFTHDEIRTAYADLPTHELTHAANDPHFREVNPCGWTEYVRAEALRRADEEGGQAILDYYREYGDDSEIAEAEAAQREFGSYDFSQVRDAVAEDFDNIDNHLL